MNESKDYQVLIVGAGMAGAALALALGRLGIPLALIESRVLQQYVPGCPHQLRVSAINHATQNLLTHLGVWDAIATERVCAYSHMHVRDALGGPGIHFDSAALQLDHLGHIVENSLIQTKLLNQIERLAHVDIISPAQLECLQVSEEKVSVGFADGRQLHAQLLVGADGAASKVRELAGMGTRGWGYEQKAVVSTVGTSRSHNATAWQRFLPSGPVAFLPLSDGSCSIVWSTTAGHAESLLACNESEFCDALTEASGGMLGEVTGCGSREAFPLQYQHADEYVASRVALVGDAAHVVHPLAGQGANLGFMDVAQLSDFLGHAFKNNHDLGSAKLLRRYQRFRKGENMSMGLALDGLKRLFGATAAPVVTARNWGLQAVDRSELLKRFFMRHAMGLTGDVPTLAMPVELID